MRARGVTLRHYGLRKNQTKGIPIFGVDFPDHGGFGYILPRFETELKRKYRKTRRGTVRMNRFKWRGELPGAAHHLSSVLTYLKENPTQEFHGAIFNISQETASGIIKDCMSALNEALRLPPCSDGADYGRFVGELKERLADNPNLAATRDMLAGCTEIRVRRPQDKGGQKDKCSGKIKKLIVSLFCGCILFAPHKFDGSVADKRAADMEGTDFPEGTYLWTDLGFFGYRNESVSLAIPHKKPRGRELTGGQKEENRVISPYRMRNEHAIGGMKRCRIMKGTIRIHDSNKRDMVFCCCPGIHNLRTVFRNAA